MDGARSGETVAKDAAEAAHAIMDRKWNYREGTWMLGLAILASTGCAGGSMTAVSDLPTSRAIESAAADDSFPSAAEAGVAAAAPPKI